MRPEIAQAWARARLSGLDPGTPVEESELADVDADSRLMVAARPVLDDLAEQLADTRFSVLLADRDSRIVDRRYGQPGLATALDKVLAVPGHRYLEETTGTNALATTFEVRRGFVVDGEEHYLESLKAFTCYGQPILHPLTHRLEGVLDITGFAADATPMLGPFLNWAVRAIEQRLELGGGVVQRQMLAAFQERSSRSRHPVLVFGDDLTLANAAATDRFDGPDQLVLRLSAREARDGQVITTLLPSGRVVHLRCTRVDGARAVLVEALAEPAGGATGRRGRTEPRQGGHTRTRTLISGEAGTGRTFEACRSAGSERVEFIDGTTLTDGAMNDLADRETLISDVVIVEHVNLMPTAQAVRLGAVLDVCPRPFILTCGPPAELASEHRALVGRCATHVQLAPLRHRLADLPQIAAAMLAELRPDAHVRLTTAALRTLMGWDWPGNLRELHAVLAAAVARRSCGEIIAGDLPMETRQCGRWARSPLEQAELDAIRLALQRAAGNKSKAAAELGIGRTTLYRRMRELGVDD